MKTCHDRGPPDAFEVEVEVVPLADGDAERRDRQLRAIVSLLRGVLARRGDPELTSRSASHLISGDDRR
ncbi:MAG: hypothetical protein WA687_00040 [Solirubrobacterales bacterium]